MSTASPDTCADVSGVATQRAASSSEPYFATASRRSCSWYAAERQPLSTWNATPSSGGIGRGPAQRVEQVGVEVGHARDLVVEDRRAVGDGTVGLAERRGARRRTDVRRADRPSATRTPATGVEASATAAMTTSTAGDAEPAESDGRPDASCRVAMEVMPPVKASAVLPARMRFSIRRRYAPAA